MSILGKLYKRVTNLTLVFVLAASSIASAMSFVFATNANAASLSSVRINEVKSVVSSGQKWVELYNSGSADVDISQWRLTRESSGSGNIGGVFSAGSSLAAGAYVLVETTSSNFQNPGTVYLRNGSNSSSIIVDSVTYPALTTSNSYSFCGSSWEVTSSPSKGAVNSTCAPVVPVDTVVPTAGIVYSPSTLTNGSVLATLTASEPINTPAGWTSVSSTVYTKSYSANASELVNITDLAGNGGNANVLITWIDTTAPGLPTLLAPSDSALINYNNFLFDWSDSTDAVSYEVQFSQSNSVDIEGALNVNVWSGDASHNQPTNSQAWSSGASGTWYWQVRAVDAAGNKSAWTTPWQLNIDIVAPVISINGGDVTIEAGDVYTKQGATWTDNYDTPGGVATILSDNVNNLVPGVYEVTYGHTDTAGNPSLVATRTVTVVDTTAPVVVLNGGDITLTEGETYNELGATWTDLVDGSGDADILGSVDTSTPGVYVLTYSYTDAAGNTGSVDRVVTVKAKPIVKIITIRNILSTTSTTSAAPISSANNAEVQGESNAEGVSSTSDQKSTETNKTDGNIFGLAWYWWLLILIALGALWWWIIGALKKRAEDEK